jgi:hypothetical protein
MLHAHLRLARGAVQELRGAQGVQQWWRRRKQGTG